MYSQGSQQALADLGLEKIAIYQSLLRYAPAVMKGLKSFGQTVGKGFAGRAPKIEALIRGKSTPLPGRHKVITRGEVLGRMGRGAKEMMIGEPRKALEQMRRGKFLGRGGLFRESLRPGGIFGAGLMYGFPGYELYKLSKTPRGTGRGAAAGRTVGETLLGWGAWKPFGLLGAIPAGILGSYLGGAVGKVFDPRKQRAQYLRGLPRQYSYSQQRGPNTLTFRR